MNEKRTARCTGQIFQWSEATYPDGNSELALATPAPQLVLANTISALWSGLFVLALLTIMKIAYSWDFRLAVSENLALYGPMRRELAGGEKYASVVFISLPKALSYFSRQEAEQKFNRKSKKNI